MVPRREFMCVQRRKRCQLQESQLWTMEVTDRPPGKDRLSARQPLVLLCDSVVRKPEKAEGTP